MPSALPRSALPVRPHKIENYDPPPRKLKHAPSTSYSDLSPLSANAVHATQHRDERPAKRPMPTPTSTIAVVNASGRQAASFIRVASAVGYQVRAQLRNLEGVVAAEIAALPNVTVLVGELYTKTPTSSASASASASTPTPTSAPSTSTGTSPATTFGVNHALIKDLFLGAQLAFINTTFWGSEIEIGKALADEAVRANIQHYIYSSMPNHSLHDPTWPSLPLWSAKYTIELYIRSLPTLAPRTTFLYTGIYNNNFTSLPYPLFCMELQADGSFIWQAPFHPDVKLPWLDAEHDVGAAVLQLVKDGRKWKGQRIALAYEMLSPREACRAFARGVGRPVRYRRGGVEVRVRVPGGYREQLHAISKMYDLSHTDASKQPPYFGTAHFESSCPEEALALWEGYRGLEEYAREVFPLEEAANGLTWMNDDSSREEEQEEEGEDDGDGDSSVSDGLTMRTAVGENTPKRKDESWLA